MSLAASPEPSSSQSCFLYYRSGLPACLQHSTCQALWEGQQPVIKAALKWDKENRKRYWQGSESLTPSETKKGENWLTVCRQGLSKKVKRPYLSKAEKRSSICPTTWQNYMSISELAGVTDLGLQYSTFFTGEVEIYFILHSSAHRAFLPTNILATFPEFRIQKSTATEVSGRRRKKIFT